MPRTVGQTMKIRKPISAGRMNSSASRVSSRLAADGSTAVPVLAGVVVMFVDMRAPSPELRHRSRRPPSVTRVAGARAAAGRASAGHLRRVGAVEHGLVGKDPGAGEADPLERRAGERVAGRL